MKFTTTHLSNIADVRTGFPLRKAAENDRNGDAVLVQMKDVDPLTGVNFARAYRINTEGHRHPDWLQEDDILFVGRGSRFFAVNIKTVKEKSVASPHFYVLRSKESQRVLPEFLAWYLNSQTAQKYYATNQEGSALPYISRRTLDALPLQLPDIETQKKIVSTYQCWRKQKLLMEEMIETKDAYINALLENTLQGEAA